MMMAWLCNVKICVVKTCYVTLCIYFSPLDIFFSFYGCQTRNVCVFKLICNLFSFFCHPLLIPHWKCLCFLIHIVLDIIYTYYYASNCYTLYCQYVRSLGIEPTTFALLTQCSNHWATFFIFGSNSLYLSIVTYILKRHISKQSCL